MRISNKLIKKLSTTVMAFAMMAVVVFTTSACHVEIADETTHESESELPPEIHSIRFTYADDSYTDYFKRCAQDYEAKHDVHVILNLVDGTDYLQLISDSSLNADSITDVYFLDCYYLGTAYLAGLAAKNELSTSENYCETALSACSANGVLVGYPLSYQTSFLAFNAKYVPDDVEITSFEDIKDFADSIFEDENEYPEEDAETTEDATEETKEPKEPIDYSKVETIFECNLSDLFVNYGFIGASMVIGGADGSDSSQLSVCNEKSMEQAQSYLDLINYFSINKNRTYEDVYNRFLEGKTVFTVMTTESLAALELEHEKSAEEESEAQTAGDAETNEATEDAEEAEVFDYGIMPFPNYDEDSNTAALSLTNCLVVNPYSAELEIAQDFAYFATFGMAGYLYKDTGNLSAKRGVNYARLVLRDAYEAYEHSVPKNKFRYGEQIYPLIEIALHNIVSGENIEEQLKAVDAYMATQIQ